MYTQKRASKNIKRRHNNPWFNNDCKVSKRKYKRYKKSLRKLLNTTEEETLNTMAKAHKKVLRKEKRKY